MSEKIDGPSAHDGVGTTHALAAQSPDTSIAPGTELSKSNREGAAAQPDTYPFVPTARRGSAETAFAAADLVKAKAPKMMARVEAYIAAHGPASPEEITEGIRNPDEHLLLTSVRARVCQLRALHRIKDSGERSLGESLRAKVIRWTITSPVERSDFATRKALEDEKGPANG